MLNRIVFVGLVFGLSSVNALGFHCEMVSHRAKISVSRISAADPSVFKASMRGNSVLPQSFLGILLFTANDLAAKDFSPIAVSEYTNSELSVEQADALGLAMTNFHKQRKIKISYESYPVEGTRVLRKTILDQLWKNETIGVGIFFSRFYNSSFESTAALGYGPGKELLVNTVNWGDPKNSYKVNRFKNLLKLAVEVLQSEEGKKLAEEYRNSLMGQDIKVARSTIIPANDELFIKKINAYAQDHSYSAESLRKFWEWTGLP